MKSPFTQTLLAVFLLVGCDREEAQGNSPSGKLPDFFGLFLDSKGEIIEIPSQAEKIEAAAKAGTASAMLSIWEVAPVAKTSFSLILYDESMRPEEVLLVRWDFPQGEAVKPEPVEVKIAPVESKKSMYRLVPRTGPSPGFYQVWTVASGGRTFNGLFSLDVNVASARAKAAAKEASVREREKTAKTPTRTVGAYSFSWSNPYAGETKWSVVVSDVAVTLWLTKTSRTQAPVSNSTVVTYDRFGGCEVNDMWSSLTVCKGKCGGPGHVGMTVKSPGDKDPAVMAKARHACDSMLQAKKEWDARFPEFAQGVR